jgi:formamidopyrimidine-DNA glycosylase
MLRRVLLCGAAIDRLERRGKQLAIVSDHGVLCFHLGMSGQLSYVPARQLPLRADHIHCEWLIDRDGRRGRLIFRDPRRFGGIHTFPTAEELHERRWRRLGPDALSISATALRQGLSGSRRSIKAALLDQQALSGVGNIYADESLFRAKLHPLTTCDALSAAQFSTLASAIRTVLRQAVAAGGSSLRDYVDGNGQPGWFALRHRVYGRAGQPCVTCRQQIEILSVAGRTSAFCRQCQPRRFPEVIHTAGNCARNLVRHPCAGKPS